MSDPTPEQWEEIAKAWISFGTMMVTLAPEEHTVLAMERLRQESPRHAQLVEFGLGNMSRLIDEAARELDET